MYRTTSVSDATERTPGLAVGGVSLSRRSALASLAKGLVIALALPRPARAGVWPVRINSAHPDPRPDIDASNVLTPEQLGKFPEVIPIYDMIREIPEVADGIRCMCGCATIPGYRSLLTCYESGGMAKMCVICQAEARAVYRWHKGGRTLDQVRAAVDARFG